MGNNSSIDIYLQANIISRLNIIKDILSCLFTCKSVSNEHIWQQMYLKRFMIDTPINFKEPTLNHPPNWYVPNKSYKFIYLHQIIFLENYIYLCCLKNSHLQYNRIWRSKLDINKNEFSFQIITHRGDILKLFIYHHTYENSYYYLILSKVNNITIYEPIHYFMYQHGLGWGGFIIEEMVSLFKDLLNDKTEMNKFLIQITYSLDIGDNGYIYTNYEENVDILDLISMKDIDEPKELKNKPKLSYQSGEGISELKHVREMAQGVYAHRQKERDNEAWRKRRGPASDELLIKFDKFMFKADRGHRDQEFEEILNELKNSEHIGYLINNVRSDLGRTFLWCCASRRWNDLAKWAIDQFGSDPKVEAGKGSAFDIAIRYNNKIFIDMVNTKPKEKNI